MKLPGRVHNGVVILEGKLILPEGARVTVSYEKARIRPAPGQRKRVQLPLIRSKRPGTLNLTNERIAEILQEEDIAAFRKSFRRTRR
jgi:hypothetical protein